jgi:hypothetical protein
MRVVDPKWFVPPLVHVSSRQSLYYNSLVVTLHSTYPLGAQLRFVFLYLEPDG